jgi:hypothetical protein
MPTLDLGEGSVSKVRYLPLILQLQIATCRQEVSLA